MGSLSSPTSHNRNFVSFSKFLPNKMLGSRDSNSLFLSNLQRPRDSPLLNHNNSPLLSLSNNLFSPNSSSSHKHNSNLFSLNNSNSSLSLSNSSDNSHNNNKAFQMPSSNRLLVSNPQATSSS